jgi:hypothetical protein
MTSRKPRPETALPARPAKLVPYPPASIWKTKEEGVVFQFRGNVFARRGNQVTQITTAEEGTQSSADSASKLPRE